MSKVQKKSFCFAFDKEGCEESGDLYIDKSGRGVLYMRWVISPLKQMRNAFFKYDKKNRISSICECSLEAELGLCRLLNPEQTMLMIVMIILLANISVILMKMGCLLSTW